MPARRLLVSYATLPIAFLLMLLSAWPVPAAAERRTVCAITINSPDERDVLRRLLPVDRYDVVELVQRGNPDWLAAACRRGVQCDALVVSGHFDGGVEFYSDRLDQGESLPVEALERAACSESCPGLFGRLKEVYLFGCNTLNAEAGSQVAREVERALRKRGASADEAARTAALLDEAHARSNRDRMRLLFQDVPVLYGFPGKAPLGHVAGPVLEGHLRTDALRDVASGRVNGDLLRRFAGVAMTATSGASASDPHAAHRRDVCRFLDRRSDVVARAAFVHEVLRRDAAEVRVLLDRVEAFVATLDPATRSRADVGAVLDALRDDAPARTRFLAFALDNGDPATRARMLDVAHGLGWLDDARRVAERLALLDERLAAGPGHADVDLACRLGNDAALAAGREGLHAPAPRSTARSAVLACLGDADARRDVLDALLRGQDDDVALAQVLLHHRPLADADEFRHIALRVGLIPTAQAQARALDVLAGRPLVDDDTFAALARLFPASRSLAVQRGIAGLLLRADYRSGDGARLAQWFREHRMQATERDVIDVLIRRLASS